MKIGEHALFLAVRHAGPDALIVSCGFSCREQIAHGTGRSATHPAQVLQLALREQSRRLTESRKPERRMAVRSAAMKAAVGLAAVAVAGPAYRQATLGR
jgi:hypothetical protein